MNMHYCRALSHKQEQAHEVRKLADGIIDAQVRKITEMKRYTSRLEAHPVSSSAPDIPSYRDRRASPSPPQTDAGINTLAPIS
jgi:uncharacterized protein (DUF305 family)